MIAATAGRAKRAPSVSASDGHVQHERATDVRVNDLWLAAHAIQRDFRLLTSNAKDFADIPGLHTVVLKLL